MTELVGIVVVGRNEGERLRRSLESAREAASALVYVDSGSTDGSVELASCLGITTVQLDNLRPFTAARARNEGFAELLERWPNLSFVQFIDGDCELLPQWLQAGVSFLAARPEAVVVCGRVRERAAEASVYSRLCEMEWQKRDGEILASGGNLMVRVEAFRSVGGFRAEVIAAEDDEFCLRLRRTGGKIFHIPCDMVLHDVAMTSFGQWWNRSRRTGHAYGQGAALHGGSTDKHFVRDCRRLWLWGLVLPCAAGFVGYLTGGSGFVLLLAYPVQTYRIYRAGRLLGRAPYDALLYAVFVMLAKFPGVIGLMEYHWRRWRGRDLTIIEHKHVGTSHE